MALRFCALAVALGVAAAAVPCSQVLEREVCIVSAEEAQTCSWCTAPSSSSSVSGGEVALCASARTAAKLTAAAGGFRCDGGDDEVPTRAVEVQGPPLERVAAFSDDYVPVVLMHGIGDAGHNRGMQSLAKSISDTYPGLYSVSVDVADGLSSYTTDIGKQIEEFAAAVRGDAKLAKGFNVAGLSQGGLIVRVYAMVYNDPPVFNMLSLCGPQMGVGDCPGGTPTFLCNMVRESLYNAPVAFAGYWKNPMDKARYLQESKWLADWNNDRDTKNSTYARNADSWQRAVLVQALNDTVVIPHVSEDFGFYTWGSESDTQGFNETDSYDGDWLGLKTLDQQGKVDRYSYVGEHLRWTEEFWYDTVMPYFNMTFSGLARDGRDGGRGANARRALMPDA